MAMKKAMPKKSGGYQAGTGGGKITKKFTAAGKKSQKTSMGRDAQGRPVERIRKMDSARYSAKKKMGR